MAGPAHPECLRMLDEQPLEAALLLRSVRLLSCHLPLQSGDPDRIRTCGPQIRNLMLYPAELRGRAAVWNRGSAARNQLTWPGGTTGSGRGATATPSSSSDLASARV